MVMQYQLAQAPNAISSLSVPLIFILLLRD